VVGFSSLWIEACSSPSLSCWAFSHGKFSINVSIWWSWIEWNYILEAK
jgi:hypothetical protein